MSYISPFNDKQNLDEHIQELSFTRNVYEINQSNVTDDDYIVNYETDIQQKFVPLNSFVVGFPTGITNNHEEIEKDKTLMPNTPITVKNDVYIHWDPLTHFYFASLTVIGLFVMFRSIQISR